MGVWKRGTGIEGVVSKVPSPLLLFFLSRRSYFSVTILTEIHPFTHCIAGKIKWLT